ncbi:baseplate multidomain protein megatron [Salinarimonas rosea]|uniref:baseplate multidomain protein megatron n=1 Tax=Salinarimonas rosea TaxID=552063 RepID=UPI00048B82B6|nr:glycoside hydrolase/phage tail family protein [Salinarimonas rosea]
MATLVLQTAGAAIGGMVGGPFGAMVGRALGGLAGAAIDGAILSSLEGESTRTVVGPRLTEVPGLASTEGAPIPRVYGRARIGGQVIWATRLEEETRVTVRREPRRGGKSSGGGGGATTREVTYAYYANLAVGLCEGPIAFVRRVFADGREIDLATITMRVYRGDEAQAPDPLIVAKEGAAPAYRGLAYVVFERLPLEPFGNRIPQLAFEVVRGGNALGEAIRAVCLIPGATEFGYEPAPVRQALGLGETKPDNRHQLQATSDVLASLDQLQALCPNLAHVFLVVSWFGDDLRVGACTIAPRVEIPSKDTEETPWAVAGLTRSVARVVSTAGGLPAYGGTPSDASVVRLVRLLKDRGLSVTLYPFQMMDVPAGNALPDPHTGAIGQPPYPWRGRITCDPAPGRPGSPDGTSLAAAQVAAFFGTTQPVHVAPAGDGVIHTGPDEWSFRRQILHYAALAQAAGGVDAIVIGTELPALTRVRSGPGSYPAVDALCALAADVRTIVGPGTKITYAADWTEYGAHVRDGGAEVRFPLDPLWAHPAIDAIGIDWYPPISDWRDDAVHLDQAEAAGGLDPDYLHRRLGAGEGFDWSYADAAARAAQARTPIVDALGEAFAFRPKDLVGWWSSPHRERVGGAPAGQTAFVPGAKPIWLTEIGVPAVDKGPNGPNVFPDPKSSESAFPPFSSGARDDLAQARGVGAILRRFDPRVPGHEPVHNPPSPITGAAMLDPDRMAVWAFDARPFPAFPDLAGVWSDGVNHETGHWLNGRLEGLPLDELIRRVLADLGVDLPVATDCDGFVDGFVLDRPMSAREALEPLLRLFGVDAVERDGRLAFVGRGVRAVATIAADERVEEGEGALERRARAQETDLPAEVELAFTDAAGGYRRAAVASRRLAGGSRRLARVETAAVLRRAQARGLADVMLQDAWSGRESLTLAVSPRRIDLEPGDVIAPPGGGLYRIGRIVDAAARRIEARAVEPTLYAAPAPKGAVVARAAPATFGRPFVLVLDLPAALGDPTVLSFAAIHARPWPGAMAIWRSGDGASFEPFDVASAPAQVGETLSPLAPGPLWRIDRAGVVDVRLAMGAVTSVSDGALFEGANRFCLRGPDGTLEIVGVGTAELIGERTYRLGRLLRGLAGSEPAAALGLPAGSALVRLDETLVPLARAAGDLGRTWRWRIGPADRDHADAAVVEIVATAGPAALLPLAPVHASARRTGEGVVLAWVRRSRLDADAWDPVDPPLGEAAEAYRIEILSAGGAVVRALSATSPQVVYPAADELADHGMPQATLAVRIAQESALVGPGAPLAATLAVL